MKKKIHTGIITKIEVKFPAGCVGMVYVTVCHKLTQLMPFNADEAAAGDDGTVEGRFYWEISESAPELTLQAWSPGTEFDHAVTVRVTVLPKAVATFMPLINVMSRFLKRIGAM